MKHRDIDYGQRIPEAVLDALEEFISTSASPNFKLLLINPTTIGVNAGVGNDQVALGVQGKWRYNSANVTAAHPGGGAGTYDIYAVASANNFVPTGGTPPENDLTDYSFGLQIVASGGTPTGTWNGNPIAHYRLLGSCTWSGTAITGLTAVLGTGEPHAGTHAPGAADPIDYTLVNKVGTLGARPAASVANNGLTYLATDAQGGTLYRSNATTWDQTGAGVTAAPSSTLVAQSILLYGTLGARAAASSGNNGFYYYASDANGGTLYQSNGTTWLTLFERVPAGGSLVAGATLATTNEFHTVIGTGTVDTLTSSGTIAGSRRRFLNTGSGTVSIRDTGGGTGNIRLAERLHATLVPGESIAFTFDGTLWWEDQRSAKHLSGESVDMSQVVSSAGLVVEDGSAISRTTFAATFANVGTQFGVGDGSTTFNVPDSRGRHNVAHVPSGGHADVSTIGQNDGFAVASRRPKHKHTVGNPTVNSHSHGGGDHGHTHRIQNMTINNSGPTYQFFVRDSLESNPSNIINNSGAIISAEAPGTSGGTVGPQTGAEPLDSAGYIVRPRYVRL